MQDTQDLTALLFKPGKSKRVEKQNKKYEAMVEQLSFNYGKPKF